MNTTFHIYDISTGAFTGQSFCTSLEGKALKEAIAANTPQGRAAYVGIVTDPLTQSINLETGYLVSSGPPVEATGHRLTVLSQIHAIEQQQARAVRDYILTGDASRIADIETEISALRRQLAQLA
jgi:hypothetical protein